MSHEDAIRRAALERITAEVSLAPPAQLRDEDVAGIDMDRLRRSCARAPKGIEELSRLLRAPEPAVLAALSELRNRGVRVRQVSDKWRVDKTPSLAGEAGEPWVSDEDGWFRFGLISDQHYGSKYCREDVAEDLYDWFADEGIERVYNCGNWIDGEGHDNAMDLLDECHGMQRQIDYCAAKWPSKPGMTTYFIAGDDHEGWYVKREHVNIGRMLEASRRAEGLDDLVYMGYVEAYVRLVRAGNDPDDRDRASALWLLHPGGGSSKQLSLKLQNIIASLQGGEKPGIAAVGHLHKTGYFETRGVHGLLVPSTKEQDTWMRKAGIDSQIGGWIVDARIDSAGGISEIKPWARKSFCRGYYLNNYDPCGDMGGRVEV